MRRRPIRGRRVEPRFAGGFAQLAGVGGQYLPVDVGRGFDGLRFDRNEDVHLSAPERAGDRVADFVFRLPVDRRQPQREVHLFGVQGADFDRDFSVRERDFAFSEAGH